ncbi:hypothetical protein CK203_058496 [Vitis vinifera]|uniref:Bifunctional inhibitor/plant lipid transfer protein/seed storage helical domain-containing protein n=1 Tax=Vitis vinifera TaxID=29760 RepID=A0A438ILC5_VITVI|nr:hypothetical protein CK203_058496 [Vitis vinifera]
MALQKKYVGFLVLLVVLGITGFKGIDAAGECGNASPDTEAWKLAPCEAAAQNEKAAPSKSCCLQPEVAVTIPKRCNLADRPVGYKCGANTVPLVLQLILCLEP